MDKDQSQSSDVLQIEPLFSRSEALYQIPTIHLKFHQPIIAFMFIFFLIYTTGLQIVKRQRKKQDGRGMSKKV
jgi:hypothetical protein